MALENGLERMHTIRRHIGMIRERMEYLQDRQAEIIEDGGRVNHYITQEIEALAWALPVLEAEWDNCARIRQNLGVIEHRLAAIERRQGPDAIDVKPTPAWVGPGEAVGGD